MRTFLSLILLPLLFALVSALPVAGLGIAVSPPSIAFVQGIPQDVFVQNPENYSINFTVLSEHIEAFPSSGQLAPYETKTIRLVPQENAEETVRIVTQSNHQQVSVAIHTTNETGTSIVLIGLLITIAVPVFGLVIYIAIRLLT